VVSMSGVAASGGYFIAAPASAILAAPGTVTGSIGVYAGKFVLTGMWEKLGVNWGAVHGGANAGIWSANQRFTLEQWRKFQALLDRTYADFVTKVQEGRKLDAAEALARERLLQRADQRDPAPDGRLEVQVQALGVRGVEQLAPARREQLLVRGDDGLVAFERRQEQRARGFEPADQLADDVDVGLARDVMRIVGELHAGDAARSGARAVERAGADPGDADRPPRAPHEQPPESFPPAASVSRHSSSTTSSQSLSTPSHSSGAAEFTNQVACRPTTRRTTSRSAIRAFRAASSAAAPVRCRAGRG